MNKLSSQDRSSLIRLASSLPAGNPTRKAILAGLSQILKNAGEFNIPGKHILDLSKVSGNATVSMNAEVYDYAEVSGDARVYGNATVAGSAEVSGTAKVYGNAEVGNAKVYGNAEVYGDAKVYGDAEVFGNAEVYGKASVSGKAKVYGRANISGTAEILGGNWDGSEGEITSGSWRGPGVPHSWGAVAEPKPSSGIGNAKQIAAEILKSFAADNDFPRGTRFPVAAVERAVANMLAAGAIFDKRGIELVAAGAHGDPSERRALISKYPGYAELDQILEKLI